MPKYNKGNIQQAIGNINFNEEKFNTIPLKAGTIQGCPPFLLCFQYISWSSGQNNKTETEVQGNTKWKRSQSIVIHSWHDSIHKWHQPFYQRTLASYKQINTSTKWLDKKLTKVKSSKQTKTTKNYSLLLYKW